MIQLIEVALQPNYAKYLVMENISRKIIFSYHQKAVKAERQAACLQMMMMTMMRCR